MNNENGKNKYFIEGTSDIDLIGFDSYRKNLKNAIENKAKFIGLISDFGTGKSTLINQLKCELDSNIYEVITINLWNCNNKNNDIKDNDNMSIHSNFLHQLIENLNIKNKNYYKKKINKKYSFIDIQGKKNNKVYIFTVLIFLILFIFDYFKLIDIFINGFTKVVSYVLLSILIVICIYMYKFVICFKKDDTTSVIDENDTRDLYKELMADFFNTKKNKNKNIIICLEELDRYDNPDILIKHIKEFYKFYKLDDKNVTFILSIKSSGMMKSSTKNNIHDIKNIYEKVFDYILNMNKINIQDFDSIVLNLLEEKKGLLNESIEFPTVGNMKSWKYLYAGNNITIRDIKHRYNFALSLYESVCASGIENVKFDKCLFISYLEDEYNLLYSTLSSDNNFFNIILLEYAKNKNLDRLNEKLEVNNINNLSSDEIDVLTKGLNSKYIDIDYMYYFYKFPKNKKSYNIYELDLYNCIYFDRNSDQLSNSLNKLSDLEIEKILKKRINEDLYPDVVLLHKKLIKICYEKSKRIFMDTLIINYNCITNYDNFISIVNKLMSAGRIIFKNIMRDYFINIANQINKLTIDERYELRSRLVIKFKNDSEFFDYLFFNDNVLISSSEMKNIRDENIIFKLTNFTKIDENYVKTIISMKYVYTKKLLYDYLSNIFVNANISIELKKEYFYSIDFTKLSINESDSKKIYNLISKVINFNDFNETKKFIINIGCYNNFLDGLFIKIVDSSNAQQIQDFINICNKRHFISDDGADLINKCNIKFSLSDFILDKMYMNHYFHTYVISKNLSNGTFEVEEEKADILLHEYINYFKSQEVITFNIGINMKNLLYNNINYDELNKNQLHVFIKEKQNVGIIENVIKTNDLSFINDYLKNIVEIKEEAADEIYSIIGEYYHDKKIDSRIRNNLCNLAFSKEQCQKLYKKNIL